MAGTSAVELVKPFPDEDAMEALVLHKCLAAIRDEGGVVTDWGRLVDRALTRAGVGNGRRSV